MRPDFIHGKAQLFHAECMQWLASWPHHTVHAVVTDPPYGLLEYTEAQQAKLRQGRGGVWRIPPSFDGHQRSPLPRFTTLGREDLEALDGFFFDWVRREVGRHARPLLIACAVGTPAYRCGQGPEGAECVTLRAGAEASALPPLRTGRRRHASVASRTRRPNADAARLASRRVPIRRNSAPRYVASGG